MLWLKDGGRERGRKREGERGGGQKDGQRDWMRKRRERGVYRERGRDSG